MRIGNLMSDPSYIRLKMSDKVALQPEHRWKSFPRNPMGKIGVITGVITGTSENLYHVDWGEEGTNGNYLVGIDLVAMVPDCTTRVVINNVKFKMI